MTTRCRCNPPVLLRVRVRLPYRRRKNGTRQASPQVRAVITAGAGVAATGTGAVVRPDRRRLSTAVMTVEKNK